MCSKQCIGMLFVLMRHLAPIHNKAHTIVTTTLDLKLALSSAGSVGMVDRTVVTIGSSAVSGAKQGSKAISRCAVSNFLNAWLAPKKQWTN